MDGWTRHRSGKYFIHIILRLRDRITYTDGCGKVFGGLLSRYLGWISIFWFLTIFASTVFMLLLLFMPETSRNIVGNGSLPSAKWNQPFVNYLRRTSKQQPSDTDGIAVSGRSPQRSSPKTSLRVRISPWSSLKLFVEKETCLLLLYSGIIYASSYVVVSPMTVQLQGKYGLDTVQVSLCLPHYRLWNNSFRTHNRPLS